MQLPANGEILHSSWDFLVRCHPRWISWVLRRRDYAAVQASPISVRAAS
jgi:hypothetical protein